jgi:hypothetical protein
MPVVHVETNTTTQTVYQIIYHLPVEPFTNPKALQERIKKTDK